MTVAAGSSGALSKMCMDSASPIDTSSIPFEFVSESLVAEDELVFPNGIRGTRSRSKERVRQGLRRVTGSITLNPSPTEIDWLLPRILGGSESNDVFPVAESLPSFLVCIDRVAKVHTYSGLYVSRATFRGREGQPLELTLDVIGETYTEGDAGSFPALTFDTDAMYVLSDGVLTLQSSAREFDEFSLTIDNSLAVKHNNSRTATRITTLDRIVTLSCNTPYVAANSDLLTTPASSAAGASATLVFTNGNQSLTFTLANLKAIARTPSVAGKQEIVLPLNYQAYKSGSTAEISITSDPDAED